MWRRIFSIKAVFLVTLLAGAALVAQREQKVFLVSQIDLEWTAETEAFCTRHESLCASFKKQNDVAMIPFLGQNIWKISIQDLRAKSLENNWFKNVFVARKYPNALKLEVELENPEALVAVRDDLFAVGANAQLLQMVKVNQLPSLPILRGENFFKDETLRARALAFLKEFPSSGEMSVRNIAEVTYSKDENFSLIVLPSKSVVKMTSDRVSLRAARVAQVIEYLNGNQMNGRVIDARFSKKVLVRLRKGS